MLNNSQFWNSLQNDCKRSQIEEILSRIYLKSPNNEYNSGAEEGKRMSYGCSSVQGWRLHQEDAHITQIDFDLQTSLFAVFDGHNGAEVALYAAQHLPNIILTNKAYKNGNIELALQQVFMYFDDYLLTKEVSDELRQIRQNISGKTSRQIDRPSLTSGCTAIVVLIQNDTIYVANIGDSRSCLSRSGKSVSLSYDHKPDDRTERERIEKSGGRVFQGRINCGLNLSRAFGDHQYKLNKRLGPEEQMVIALPDIKVKTLKHKKDEFLVIACDGIWNCMSNQKVVNFVRKRIKSNKSLSNVCEELIDQCLSPVRPIDGRTGGDNMTCIIIKFNETDLK